MENGQLADGQQGFRAGGNPEILSDLLAGVPHYESVCLRQRHGVRRHRRSAQFVYFNPTPLELHKNTALWFWDQQVFDFVAEHLHVIDPDKLSSRTYVKAYERKAKGDWKEFIARRYFEQSSEKWVVALESSREYRSVEERVAEFVRRTGASRSTYFNLKKALKADERLQSAEVPRFVLTAQPPEAPDLAAEVEAAAEKDRRRRSGTTRTAGGAGISGSGGRVLSGRSRGRRGVSHLPYSVGFWTWRALSRVQRNGKVPPRD